MSIAGEDGSPVLFLGALRRPHLRRTEVWEGMPIRRVGIYYPVASLWYIVGTPIYVLCVLIWLIRHKPRFIHASDVEGMCAPAFYRLLGGRAKIVFNIHDNYALKYRVPRWLKVILAKLEAFLGERADMVLVPDESRLRLLSPWKPRSCVIIPNSPRDPGYLKRRCDGRLRIFAPGDLIWQRGYKALGELARRRGDVSLVVCGSGPTEVEEYVRNLPRAEYHGLVPQNQSLELGKSCDVVVAFYDPQYEINRYASSNKLHDAMALGRAVIVNNGVMMSDWVQEKRIGYSVPYGDVEALDKLVTRLLNDQEEMYRAGARGRALYEEHFDWRKLAAQLRAVLASD